MMVEGSDDTANLGRRLVREVLLPLKQAFVGKDEIIDLLGVCLAGGENLFLHGPPGTAKSALVRELARRLDGQVFDYLLTRFTEPNELFGPFDIRKLRDGELLTNTEGMLPEASLVFLDELLNANSAILNSLLMVLNERVFRRGRETRALPTLMVVSASNSLPEDETLGALFDRFLLRVRCDQVPDERLTDVLTAGWRMDAHAIPLTHRMSEEDIRKLQKQLPTIDLDSVRADYAALVVRLRAAGIPLSDRRAVKLQRLVAASALICGRAVATRADLWILRYVWDTEEQQEVLAAIVQAAVDQATDEEKGTAHPRSQGSLPDPEALARDLEEISTRLQGAGLATAERAVLRDRLSVLASRMAWVELEPQRAHLQSMFDTAWAQSGAAP